MSLLYVKIKIYVRLTNIFNVAFASFSTENGTTVFDRVVTIMDAFPLLFGRIELYNLNILNFAALLEIL